MYLDEYKRWLAADLEDADLKPELAKVEGNDDEIKDRFAVALKFGTAGLRGVLGAGTNRMNIYVVRQATQGLANWVLTQGGTQTVAISYDSRLKSDVFAKTAAGVLAANGIKVRIYDALMPVPALSFATRYYECNAGIMVTASHNPSDDNGIKIFNADGFKLPDEVEDEIERIIRGETPEITPSRIGKAYRIDDARGRYIEFAKSSIQNRSLKGTKAVLDCANGAAYYIAPLILKELGVEVIAISTTPNGTNINENCGATHPEEMCRLVREHHADVGISLDGDADRVIFCDADGNVVNGDRIIGLCALDYKAHGRLSNNAIAVTSMSNLGLLAAMKTAGIHVEVTAVGDRYVIEKMREMNLSLGGEQSGHLIFLDYVTTGDGIISALHVLNLMKGKDKPLKELAAFMEEYPQKLVSMPVRERVPIEQLKLLSSVIADADRALQASGRVVVRYSGTENKIRLLVEAKDAADVELWLGKLTEAVKKELA